MFLPPAVESHLTMVVIYRKSVLIVYHIEKLNMNMIKKTEWGFKNKKRDHQEENKGTQK